MAVILPLGLSIDSSTSDLPFLQCFSGGDPAPDDVLLQDLWLDPHHLSCPLPSPAADPFSAAACLSDLYDPRGELDACGLSGLHFLRANPVPSNFLETQFLSELAAFPFQVEKAEVAAALQTSPPALAPGLPETGGYIGGFPTSRPGGERPSAQSVAARQRRKRISEKTHELGQLVPGGNRMNTAEMLQSAFKYVKFLQAQVAMLGVICSMQPEQQAVVPQLLPPLLCSPAMQEKLTSEEKCVVPTSVLRALLEDKEIKSHPSICSDLRSLLTPSLIRS